MFLGRYLLEDWECGDLVWRAAKVFRLLLCIVTIVLSNRANAASDEEVAAAEYDYGVSEEHKKICMNVSFH